MKSQKTTHNIIKKSYAAWSALYIIETIISLTSSPNHALAGLNDLTTILPPESVSELTDIATGVSILIPILTIGIGWPMVLLLSKDKDWIFYTFVTSCFISILASVGSFFFPAEGLSLTLGRLFCIGYLCVLLIMLIYSYRLRDQLREHNNS